MFKKKIIKGSECLNCKEPLNNQNYCPNCGQLNNTAKPTFLALVGEALSNLFAFDSKFYLSIWPLLLSPGKLSLAIVAGEKTKYLTPIRLFLLVIIVMLGINSLSERLARPWDDIEHLKHENTTLKKDTINNEPLNFKFSDGDFGKKMESIFKYIRKNPNEKADTGLKNLGIAPTFWNHFAYVNLLKFTLLNQDELFDYIFSNLLFILLSFVPILALILKALYFYKRSYFYVDHFIFSLHTLTAFFAFIILADLISYLIGDGIYLGLFLGFGVYLFLAIKNFYKQGFWLTFLKYSIINFSFIVVSIFFTIAVGFISFLLF